MSGTSVVSGAVDMATALDLPLGVENEAKFVALRNLHLKKIKQLMVSLDSKDREIAKLKILSKDNRRTQMIQALRNKVRDLELINDVVKEELTKKAELTVEEVNQQIIRKTLGGPKRFRPLTREELENKIAELEKKLSKKPNQADNTMPPQEARNEVTTTQRVVKPSDETNKPSNEFLDPYSLFDEVQALKATLDAKESIVHNLRDEIVRLRSRNAELVSFEEEIEFYERQSQELKECNQILTKNLEETAAKLAVALESVNKWKVDISLRTESDKSEVKILQDQCNKLVKQNSSLLKSLSIAEESIQRFEEENMKSNQRYITAESSSYSKDSKIKLLEEKVLKLEEKCKQVELRCGVLENEAAQVPSLKNQLRDKNIEIRDLSKKLERYSSGLKNSNSKGGLRPDSPELLSTNAIAEEKEKESNDAVGEK